MCFDIFRLYIVEEFNRDIYDYIIVFDESVFDVVVLIFSIFYKDVLNKVMFVSKCIFKFSIC